VRSESHDSSVLLELFDSHEGEIVGVPPAKAQRWNSVQPASGRRRVMQQLAERYVFIADSHDIHSTVEVCGSELFLGM